MRKGLSGVSAAAMLAIMCVAITSSVSFGWFAVPAPAGVTVVPDVADNQFSGFSGPSGWAGAIAAGGGEWLYNNGGRAAIRVKGHQDVSGLKFNLAGYRGQRVIAAELHLTRSNYDAVFSLAAATINTDWSAGNGSSNPQIGAACWRWRSTPSDYVFNNNSGRLWTSNEWTFPRSDFSTTTFGNFGSLTCFGIGDTSLDVAPDYGINDNDTFRRYDDGTNWCIAMKLDPALIYGMILDQPGGLAVTDARQHRIGNPEIFSSNAAGYDIKPRLMIQFAAGDTNAPIAVNGLTASAGIENGEAVLTFTAPSDAEDGRAFGYNVKYSTVNSFASATNVDRWRIPRPKSPGAQQSLLIEKLNPSSTYFFFVQPYDTAGNNAIVASTSLVVPAAIPTPALVSAGLATPNPAGKSVLQDVGGLMKYFAASEVVRINPAAGGYAYGWPATDDYKKANMVWDSSTNTVSLRGCRNEMIGSQLMLGRTGASLTNVAVTVSDLTGPGGSVISSNPNIELFQMHYVGSESKYPEAAIPLSAPFPATFSIPDSNHNAGGYWQSVYMDIYVPQTVTAGDYTGTVTLAATGMTPVTVNLSLRVSNLMIPDSPTFVLDYNGYGNPWDFGTNPYYDTCTKYFQVVHKHRGVPNTLGYSHVGATQADRRPGITSNGPTRHANGWSTLDAKYGPFFSTSPATSAFTSDKGYVGPGANTPVSHYYTVFNESWPESMVDPVYGFDVGGRGPSYWYNLLNVSKNFATLFTQCPDVWTGFNEGYRQANRNLMGDWLVHARDSGWTKTAFQNYLNNKYYYATSGPTSAYWVLEENEDADDFRACGFFHQNWREGYDQSGVTELPWHFRIDISDRWGLHWGQLDNRVNWWNLGSGAADWHWPHIKYRPYFIDSDKPETWISYGGGSDITGDSYSNTELVLRRWSEGFAGLLPWWDCYKTDWTTGDDLSLIYSGSNVPGFGQYRGPIISMRIKQMRQVQQIVELLNIWAEQPGMNRPRVRDAFFAKYGDGSTFDYSFNTLTEEKIYKMRADLVSELESFVPAVPSDPNPADVTFDVPVTQTFSWSGQAAGVTFDVYMGAEYPLVTKVATALTTASFTPSAALSAGTTYYWRVEATNMGGTVSSPEWIFFTHQPGDIDGDGFAGVSDLQYMVGAWATVAGPPADANWLPEADLDNNGRINIGDLQILVANWGGSAFD